MKSKLSSTIITGIIATAAMTLEMIAVPIIGMPRMSAPEMLEGMLGVPNAVGWILHFMIGTIFTGCYVYFFQDWLKKISSKLVKGILFGLAVFVFAQIFLGILGSMMQNMPPMEDSMALTALASLLGHLIFGIVVALMVDDKIVIPVE